LYIFTPGNKAHHSIDPTATNSTLPPDLLNNFYESVRLLGEMKFLEMDQYCLTSLRAGMFTSKSFAGLQPSAPLPNAPVK
jgi:hypothetical protein